MACFEKDGYRFETVPFAAAWMQVETDWAELFGSCNSTCVFYHPQFLSAAVVLPLEDQPNFLILGRREGTLVFGLPVQLRRSALTGGEVQMYSPEGMGFDHLEAMDSTPAWSASRTLLSDLRRAIGVQTFRGGNVSSDFTNVCMGDALPGVTCFQRQAFRCPYKALPESEAALGESLSAKFRYNTRRSLRQVQEAGVQFRMLTGDLPDHTLVDALDRLFELHAERAIAASRESKFLHPNTRRFHDAICRGTAAAKSVVRFVEAVQDDQVVGSLYGFRAGKKFLYFQSGFRDEFSRFSMGSLLIYWAMVEMIGERATIFDFLRGQEDYKAKWMDDSSTDFLISLAASPAARISLAFYRWKRAMRRQGRRAGTIQWLKNKD